MKVFELENVSFFYQDGSQALKDINICINSGESFTILGANGSGKSTLLKILDALYFPKSGTLKFKGESLSPSKFKNRKFARNFRSQVGLLFQDPDIQLISASVKEDILFGPLQLGIDEKELKRRFEIAVGFFDLQKILNKPPFKLSEGEKRKVALASILTIDPEIWLLDEPTANLDPRSTGKILDFLMDLKAKGKTMVIATHNLEVAYILSDKICILGENHRILKCDTPEKILEDKELLQKANLLYIHKHIHGKTIHSKIRW